MNKQINIGWAQTDITPDRPVYVIGQLYSRISSYVHDPITATCLVLENGEAIGYGKHDELMESCESYREISRSQMGDGKKEEVTA